MYFSIVPFGRKKGNFYVLLLGYPNQQQISFETQSYDVASAHNSIDGNSGLVNYDRCWRIEPQTASLHSSARSRITAGHFRPAISKGGLRQERNNTLKQGCYVVFMDIAKAALATN